MVKRSEALCNGEIIKIESVYNVINGKQINIKEKIDKVRELGRKGELFCTCGCGMQLILVAGDKCLRDQHFREKIGIGHKSCDFQDEGDLSVYSKRVLKEWFTDKLKIDDIEYRVPIDNVEETKRKPEFTVLSRKSKFAIRYWRHRANICKDKVDVLLDNNTRIKTIILLMTIREEIP